MIYSILLLLGIIFPPNISNPIELGDVQWLRSLEKAQLQSDETGKPILILFQEVPGCATCKNYGSKVLTHPLIVESIEDQFVPLAIYNNKKGADAEVLSMFHEPSWNNPVVRIVDQNLKNLAPRLNGNYTRSGLVNYMVHTLVKTNGKAPTWMQLLADEVNTSGEDRKTAVYSMYCFWTGEALFGKLNGVVETEPGFANGKEVVKVTYDSRLISKSQLDKIAQQSSCKAESRVHGYKPDNTPKYYLSRSKYAELSLTPLQQCRVNSALAEGQDPSIYLSPRQLKLNR